MSSHVESDVTRGALVNALGFLLKLAGPAFLVVIARLYGTDTLGVYLTAYALVEMTLALLVSGFKDGALIFVARHADHESEHRLLYQALVNAMVWSLILAGLVIVATFTLGNVLIPSLYSSFGTLLLSMLKCMAWVLPLMVCERIVLGATQGLKIMKYEAFLGGVKPVLLLITASLFWLGSPDAIGLALAYVTTQVLVFVIAANIYHRELAWRPLWEAARKFEINRELVGFAVPQNINATFDRFITNIDVVMLGIFGFVASDIGFYGAGALIVREMRQVKLIFSSAFAPHIVRLFKEHDFEQLSRSFAKTSQWIATPLIPALVAVAILRSDLLSIVHPDFAGQSAVFMLYLLLIPYLQGSFGLAGNVVVMTGHSKLNLFNSATAGVSNVLLNLLLIPPFGLIGAAAASGLTAIIKATLELSEMTGLLRVRLLVAQMYKPHLAGLVAAVLVTMVMMTTSIADASFVYRVGLLIVALSVYAGILQMLNRRRGASAGPSSLETSTTGNTQERRPLK